MKKLAILSTLVATVVCPFTQAFAASDANLVAALAQQSGKTEQEARLQVDQVVAAIKSEMIAGHDMTIRNFGKFYISEMGAREVRNPRTGQKMQIEARRYPKFSSADSFKEDFRTPGVELSSEAVTKKSVSAAAPVAKKAAVKEPTVKESGAKEAAAESRSDGI